RKDQSCKNKQGNTGADNKRYIIHGRNRFFCSFKTYEPVSCKDARSRDSTECMKNRPNGPDKNGPEKAFLGIHPVDEFPGKHHTYRIENREQRRDVTVIGIVPVELGLQIIFPGKGKHLPVKVINSRGEEKQNTD